MIIFTYSVARQNLAKLFDIAKNEEVIIPRRDGSNFSLMAKEMEENTSPFEVPGIQTKASTQYILDAVRESRSE